jgi:hypothetical protein
VAAVCGAEATEVAVPFNAALRPAVRPSLTLPVRAVLSDSGALLPTAKLASGAANNTSTAADSATTAATADRQRFRPCNVSLRGRVLAHPHLWL